MSRSEIAVLWLVTLGFLYTFRVDEPWYGLAVLVIAAITTIAILFTPPSQ